MHVDIYNLTYISNRRRLLRGKRNLFLFIFLFLFERTKGENKVSLAVFLLWRYEAALRFLQLNVDNSIW